MYKARFTLADVLVVAIVCLLLLAVGLPARSKTREYTYNIRCASNLKQIAEAIQNYAKQNGGAYPRTVADADPKMWTSYTMPLAPDPFIAGGPAANDVTAAMFLLLRTQALKPELFVCSVPRSITPWDFGGAQRTAVSCSNFPSGAHLSYSYANPYPSAAAVAKGYKLNNKLSAEFPVMADMNPGTAELLKVSVMASMSEMKRANSANHFRGDGQNVLFGDGHAEYLQNPFVGVQRDNIYTYGGSQSKIWLGDYRITCGCE